MSKDKFNFSLKNFLSNKKPEISSSAVAEKFSAKMKDIAIKDKENETKKLAASLKLSYIYLSGLAIRPESLRLIPEQTSSQLKIICFYDDDKIINIGVTEPNRPDVQKFLNDFRKKHRRQTKGHLISKYSFNKAYALYKTLPKIKEAPLGVEIFEKDFLKYKEEIITFKDLERKAKSVSLTDLITLVIAAAIKSRASDIHIEAEQNLIKVRFRVDGILHDVAAIDKENWPKIIARVKLLAKLKINVSERPQDGRFTIYLTKERIDVRVSVLPTGYGESIVMRLLMSSAVSLTLETLGLEGKTFEKLSREIANPNGMVVTTGPTGSGKTTTLYAILNKLNTPDIKIITIEDPIEYRLEGINQSQVDAAKNYTFANGLRSILRQDPDIVMVGEIRDLETADISMNAALTGHLVLSTLHTNDASGTIPRLLSMGVKPFLLAPAINAMVGQRLVRRLCPDCKESDHLGKVTLQKIENILKQLPLKSNIKVDFSKLKFYKSRGCPKCQGLGFWGRIGIYEVMTMNPEIEQLVLSGRVSEYDMQKVAVKHGLVTMLQDGLLKALKGITSVDEVFRVAKDITQNY